MAFKPMDEGVYLKCLKMVGWRIEKDRSWKEIKEGSSGL